MQAAKRTRENNTKLLPQVTVKTDSLQHLLSYQQDTIMFLFSNKNCFVPFHNDYIFYPAIKLIDIAI